MSPTSYLIVIAPNGSEVSHMKIPSGAYSIDGNGVVFSNRVIPSPRVNANKIDNIATGELSAFDQPTRVCLWNYTMPTDRRITMVINSSDTGDLIEPGDIRMLDAMYNYSRNYNVSQSPSGGIGGGRTGIPHLPRE
jgi:hypothetical protein